MHKKKYLKELKNFEKNGWALIKNTFNKNEINNKMLRNFNK